MQMTLEVKQGGLSKSINDTKRAFEMLARMLSNKGVKVVYRGTQCCTDGDLIVLPELSLLEKKGMTAEQVKEAQTFLNNLRGYLFHEVGHVLHTNSALFEKEAKAGGRLLQFAVNGVEDVYVERKVASEWRGASVSLSHMNQWMSAKVSKNIADMGNESLIAQALLAFTWTAKLGADSGLFEDLPAPVKKLVKMLGKEAREARKVDSTAESVALARRVLAKLREVVKEEEKDEDEEEQGKSSKGNLGTEGAEGEEEAEDSGSEDELTEGEKKQLRAELEDEEEIAAELEENGANALVESEFKDLNQCDDAYRAYTTEFDEVSTLAERPPEDYAALLRTTRTHTGIVKRNLANLLRARADQLTVSELEEGDLDPALLYRLANNTSVNVFKEDYEQLELKNVGLVLLVNESGSMELPVSGTGKNRMAIARETVALLGEVLDSLGIEFAVYGHTTGSNASNVFSSIPVADRHLYTRFGATLVHVVKDFDEPFRSARHRIPSLHESNNTHDAEALQFAANRLLSRTKLTRRLIFTIDDGEPFPNLPGLSYFAQQLTPEQERLIAIHQARVKEVLPLLTAAQVEVLAFGMGTAAVAKFYPKHVVVNDVATFPEVALRELRKALAPASKNYP